MCTQFVPRLTRPKVKLKLVLKSYIDNGRDSLRLRHYLLIYGWISCGAADLGCDLVPLVSASHCCEQGGLALTGLEV